MAIVAEELDLRLLAAQAAHDGLRRMRAYLDEDRFQDLVSYLVIVGLRADVRFDPSFGQARSTYLYRRMRPRIVDWYRQTMGDDRYSPAGDRTLHPRSAIPFPDVAEFVAGEYEIRLEASMPLAVQALGQRVSDEGREKLATIARPLAEGYEPQEIAKRLGVRRAEVERRLERLRDELAAA